MRLAFIDPEPVSETGGGIRAYIRLASTVCQRHGIAVTVFSHNPAAYSEFESRPIQRRIGLPRGVRALAYRLCHGETVAFEHARWLSESLQKEMFDLVEFADFQGYAFFALRDPGLRRRVVLRVHTPLYLVYAGTSNARGFLNRLAFFILRGREQFCLRRAAWITAPSAEFIGEKLPWLRNVRTLPNPPPAPDPSPLSPAPNRSAENLLFLGRLEPRKGARELLQAFLRLAREFPEVTLTFMGDAVDASYCAQMHNLLAEAAESIRHRVHWRKAQGGDKSQWLREYSALLIPSLWENSPYVFWEGMAAGLPCLGAETGEMKRARQWTQAPCLPPGDMAAWTDALRRLLTSPNFCAQLVERQNEYLRAVAAEAEKLPEYYRQCYPQSANPA